MNKFDINYRACQYASSKSSLIEDLCSDLFSNTKIKEFGYLRILADGRYLFLCSHLDFTVFYLENIHSNRDNFVGKDMRSHHTNGYYCTLLPKKRDNYLIDVLYNFNLWNGLCFFKRQKQYIEAWSFVSDKSVDSLSDYYFNYLEPLQSFAEDFSTLSIDLFKDAKENLAIYKEYQIGEIGEIGAKAVAINYKTNKERIDQFMKLTEPKRKIAIVTDRGEEYLTKSELFCMEKLMIGLGAKEIARLATRSHRTVEKHIENIKKKLECRSIHDLKNIYRLGKILPLDHR